MKKDKLFVIVSVLTIMLSDLAYAHNNLAGIMIQASCRPAIAFTSVPTFGTNSPNATLRGVAYNINPKDFKIIVFIKVNGLFFVKPFDNQRFTSISTGGSFAANIDTGGTDESATQITAFLVPIGFTLPQPTLVNLVDLPQELFSPNPFPSVSASRSLGQADFRISIAPSSQSTIIGSSTSFTITAVALNNFNDTINLGIIKCFDSSITTSLSSNTISPGSSATLTVNTTTNTPIGTTSIIVLGMSNSIMRAIPATLNVVFGFSLDVTPIVQTITAGESTRFTVNVKGIDGFTQPQPQVTLTATANQTSIEPILSSAVIVPDGSSTLTVSTKTNTPQGTYTIRVMGRSDQFSQTQNVTLNVNAANLPPNIASIPDQTVKAGEVKTVMVSASDPNGVNGLKLTLVESPSFVTLSDNGDGRGVISIAPALMETQGGTVRVQVMDPGGLTARAPASFKVTVQKAVVITSASFSKPILSITGFGFGMSGAKVIINNQDVSSRITTPQTDTSVTLKGSKKKLNLKKGTNEITITSGGIISNKFILIN